MSSYRYQALQNYLKETNKATIILTTAQIEAICKFKLPKSANISSWWSNTPENGHTQAKAWVDAGYRVTVEGSNRVFLKK